MIGCGRLFISFVKVSVVCVCRLPTGCALQRNGRTKHMSASNTRDADRTNVHAKRVDGVSRGVSDAYDHATHALHNVLCLS